VQILVIRFDRLILAGEIAFFVVSRIALVLFLHQHGIIGVLTRLGDIAPGASLFVVGRSLYEFSHLGVEIIGRVTIHHNITSF
jgi:hypothetical protein